MTANFSRNGLLAMLLLLLAACGGREPGMITPTKDAAAAIEPFLDALRNGDKAAAAKLITPAATDELDAKFADDSKKLSAVDRPTPRLEIPNTPSSFDGSSKVTLVYAAKKDGKWTSATVRVYRGVEGPYRVEYWRVANVEPSAAIHSGMDPKAVRTQQQMTFWVLAALSLFGVLGIILLIWIVRRKPHLVVNETQGEERAAASTVREE
jgi:hypothetical protein